LDLRPRKSRQAIKIRDLFLLAETHRIAFGDRFAFEGNVWKICNPIRDELARKADKSYVTASQRDGKRVITIRSNFRVSCNCNAHRFELRAKERDPKSELARFSARNKSYAPY